MRCQKCSRVSPENSNFCGYCGASLQIGNQEGITVGGQRNWIPLLSIVCVLAVLFFLWWLWPSVYQKRAEKNVPKDSRISQEPSGARRKAGFSSQGMESYILSGASDKHGVTVAEARIDHTLGVSLEEIPTAVLKDGWVALPLRSCYGGNRIGLHRSGKETLYVSGGFLRGCDPVVLWKSSETGGIEGPGLAPWDPEEHVSWHSIVSNKGAASVRPRIRNHKGNVITFDPDIFPLEPGLIFQRDRVVGWTFGTYLDKGVLWNGQRGEGLEEEIGLDLFYETTFAGSREEVFLKVLAATDDSMLGRLKILAEGFRSRPALSAEDVPYPLQTANISVLMRKLAGQLIDSGFEKEVADALDTGVLYSAGDVELMLKALDATESYYGYASAADLADRLFEVKGHFHKSDILTRRILTLYLDWTVQKIDQNDTLGGWRVYERARDLFPEDPAVKLLGVELQLLEGDWRSAESLMPTREIPAELATHVKNLSMKIAGMKTEEGKIVIHFDPGLRHIPVKATINHRVEQDFMIDTGSSMVTIPTKTADAAGIYLDGNTPVRTVSTAGGPAQAREVTLDVLTLEGRSVENLKAWILDIPGRPEIGLLGLNYLNRFHMEINSDEGKLLLTPRQP